MEDNNDQADYDNVTRYALVIVVFILLALVVVFAQKNIESVEKTLPERTEKTTASIVEKPRQQTLTISQQRDELEPQNGVLMTKPILPEQAGLSSQPKVPKQQVEEKTAKMKVEQRKIPGNKSVKMTDLLPEELKNSIKEAMLTDEQIRALTPEERTIYKKTQRDIIDTLRELAGLEAENKRLKGAIQDKAKTSEELNDDIEALRKMFE
jgi:cell shape-determining protein MreC